MKHNKEFVNIGMKAIDDRNYWKLLISLNDSYFIQDSYNSNRN